jgi:MFS family permease
VTTAAAVGDSLRAALATADLRRLQLAWCAAAVGAWVFFIALAVYAFDAGGATAVGVAALVRMVPAGVAAPFAGLLADRNPRRDVLLISLIARALVLGAIAAAIAAGAPLALVLTLAALFTIVSTAHKPAQAALLPTLAETPRQLAASNAVWSGTDNAAFLFGSLLGGALIALSGVDIAFLVTALLFGLAAWPIARIGRDPVPSYRADPGGSAVLSDAVDGFRAIARDARLRLVVGFLALSTLVEGAVDVLVVVVAIDLLDLGGPGVGWLNACWGLGGLIGGLASLALLARGHLAAGLSVGGLLVGLPLMAIAGLVSVAVAAPMLVLLGVGYAVIEVAGLSLLQRLASDALLARAFAVVESSYWITTGLGAILAPALIMGLGVEGALVAVGACLPLVVLLRWGALARFEAAAPVPEREFAALRALPAFAPLPIATVENVARRVSDVRVPAGGVVIREGEVGDVFFVVVDGLLDVTCRDEPVGPVAPGDYFGEIAVLRDCPRTATVTARTDTHLFALDRELFLCAFNAHACTTKAVRATAEQRYERAHAV